MRDLNEKIAEEVVQLNAFDFFGLMRLLEIEGEEFTEIWEKLWDKIGQMSRRERRKLLRILRATEKRHDAEDTDDAVSS